MLHDDKGWRLSPAFDLVPNIGFNQEHVLRIGLDNWPPNRKTLLSEAKYFGVKRVKSAEDLVQEVNTAVSEWPSIFSAKDVPKKDTETIGKEIGRRLQKQAPSNP